MTLEETLAQIKPLDKNAMDVAAKRWDSIAKPLHSLGKMEKLVIQIAGITGNPDMKIQKRALVPMCADNGVVEEGVTQTGQEVTAIVAENLVARSPYPSSFSLRTISIPASNACTACALVIAGPFVILAVP